MDSKKLADWGIFLSWTEKRIVVMIVMIMIILHFKITDKSGQVRKQGWGVVCVFYCQVWLALGGYKPNPLPPKSCPIFQHNTKRTLVEFFAHVCIKVNIC